MNKLNISDIKIQLMEKTDKFDVAGYCNLVINDAIKLCGIAIRNDNGNLRLSYPAKKVQDKSYTYFYPIRASINSILAEAIKTKMKEMVM